MITVMKNILNISAVFAALSLLASCEVLDGDNSFLAVHSESQTTLDTYFVSEAACRAATAPLYNKVWFDFNNNFGFGFMDGRANNVFAPWSAYIYPFVNLTETTSTENLYSAWQSLFVIVTQSDYTLNNLDKALSNGVSQAVVDECKAECRFMRGLAYWYLAMSWGNVPIIEDPQTIITNPAINTNPTEDVLAFAIRDMEYAAEKLPSSISQAGRVTSWSAKGMLARFYNTAAAFVRGDKGKTGSLGLSASQYYEKAKAAAADVIDNSPYALLENYEDLFKVQNNNNKEVLFALQWVPNTDYGTTNFTDAYLAPSSTVAGGRSAWGGSTYGAGELVKLFADRGDLIRLAATYMVDGYYYDYIRSDEGGYLVGSGTGSYDPETGDFVVVTKDDLTNGQSRYAWMKKGMVGSSFDTGGLATNQNSCFCNPLLRLADVMLHYCEAAIGESTSTADAKALTVFNDIRDRAGLDPVTEITVDGLWDERRCELALEYVAWPDFVRRAYYQEAWVLDFMKKQNRNCAFDYTYGEPFEWVTDDSGKITKVGSTEEHDPTPDRLLLPYPESELIKNQLLKADPVPYTFAQ